MRNSNLQFAKGSIVFADFPSNSDLAYLNQRPLLVVSHPIHIFNQIVICPIGSRMKPGIQCRLWNYKSEKPWGGYEIGTIYPYNLVSIRTEAISRQIGMMDHFIMREVDRAIAFFLGLSEEIPEFMKDREEFYSVEYTHLNQAIDCSQKLNWEYERMFSTMVCSGHESDETQQPTEAEPKPEESQVETESGSQMEESGSPETQTEVETESEKIDEKHVEGRNDKEAKLIEVKKNLYIPADKRIELLKKYIPSFDDYHLGLAYDSITTLHSLYITAFIQKYVIFDPNGSEFPSTIYKYYTRICPLEGWDEIESRSGFGRTFYHILRTFYTYPISFTKSNKSSSAIKSIDKIRLNKDAIRETIERLNLTKNRSNTENDDTGTDTERSISNSITIELPDDVDEEVKGFANTRFILDSKVFVPYNHQTASKYVGLTAMCMILSRRVPLEAVAIKYGISVEQAAEFRKSLETHAFNEVNHALMEEKNLQKFNKYHSLYKIALAIMLEFKLYQPNSGKILVQLNQVTLPVRNEYRIKFTDNSVWADMGGGNM